jgi:hypothetical protein
MPAPGKTLSSVESPSSVEPLPLFRPEAIAALQQKFHGEIILIRPFSLMLLGWFAVGIVAAIVGFLCLGQYTERARVPGIVTVASSAGLHSVPDLEAEFYVPGRWIGRLQPGKQLSLRCEACSAQFGQPSGTILEISDAPLDQAELSRMDLNLTGPAYKIPVYKVKVSLPPPAAQFAQANPSPQTGTKMEAEIPLGRKPLIKWFFERSGS